MTDRYSIAAAPQLDEATIMVSLGEGATYETFERMLLFLAGKAEWQQETLPHAVVSRTPEGAGYNIALNGEDVNVVDVDEDDGIEVRPPLTDEWNSWGPSRWVRWEDVQTIVIF